MLKEWLLKKALDVAFDRAKQYLATRPAVLACGAPDVSQALSIHQGEVQRWSEQVTFADLKHNRSTAQIYVGLDLFVIPRSLRLEDELAAEHMSFSDAVTETDDHLILLGQPGAGKTTSVKYLCHRLLHEEQFLDDRSCFPVVLRLRDLNRSSRDETGPVQGVVLPALAEKLGLRFNATTTSAGHKTAAGRLDETSSAAVSTILLFLEELRPLILLDGFDEIGSRDLRDAAIAEIRNLAVQLNRARIVVTSRTGEFPYRVENASLFEFCALSREQIRIFAHKWLPSKDVEGFVGEVLDSPFADTAIKPLTLAHLCAIFERLGHVPDKPKTVYRKVVNLLLEEWDEQRSVTRRSKFDNFSPDRKFDFLCRLAFELSTSGDASVFTLDDVRSIYSRLYADFELGSGDSKQVVNEIEGHTGLFVQSGYESFEFVHRSLQEYLTAEYIKGLPSLLTDPEQIVNLPNELAIAVAISTNPSRYLVELVTTRFLTMPLPSEFMTAFVSRLLQEKPEFNTHEEVVVALLTLYTLYLDRAVFQGQQLSLFVFDSLTTQFEQLLRSMQRRNRKNIISKYYTRGPRRPTADETSLITLCLKPGVEKQHLPKELYARETFLTLPAASTD